ncbi:M23 family metallopeptidase [Nocardia sp. NBC_01377]|uniref:M23 family metallopeptidase n=1 Tax=Nocardia sp. NBC_01377 TaxID=2903595 RepID=UPI00386F474F
MTRTAIRVGARRTPVGDRSLHPAGGRPSTAWNTRRTTGFAVGLAVAVALHSWHPASAAPTGEFDWPLRPRPQVERRFDKPARDWLPGHRGVDLAGVPGQDVLAAGSGIVVFAGEVAGRPVVSIDHPGGLRTTYEPVRARVSIGSRVGRGSGIGELDAGHEGCAAAACLHWGLRREAGARTPREYLDPLALLHLSPLRLKPAGAR